MAAMPINSGKTLKSLLLQNQDCFNVKSVLVALRMCQVYQVNQTHGPRLTMTFLYSATR